MFIEIRFDEFVRDNLLDPESLSHEAKRLILFVTRLPVIFKPQIPNITFQKHGEDAIKGACIL